MQAFTYNSTSPWLSPETSTRGELEEAGGLCTEAGSHEKRFVWLSSSVLCFGEL